MAHRIRLGPPWKVTSADGRFRHRRSFGQPRTLDRGACVYLVISTSVTAQVLLNGEFLGTTVEELPFQADITSRLTRRNELVIDSPSEQGPVEVALFIGPGLTEAAAPPLSPA